MKQYTSQGFMQFMYSQLTKQDLKSGELSVKNSVSVPFPFDKDEESVRNAALARKNILEAAACDPSVLEAREQAVDIQKVERSIQEAASVWAEAASELILLQMAKDLQAAAIKPTSTNCVWTDEPARASYEYVRKTISNNCFSATVYLVGWREYDSQAGEYVWTDSWNVKWMLSTHYNTSHTIIKNVEHKYSDLEEAKGYLQRRMDYLSKKYFY